MLTHRLATEDDHSSLSALMALAIGVLQKDFLSEAEITASQAFMGLDTRLITDRTYFLVEEDGRLVGWGGWGRRATLYGGDHSTSLQDAALLDPAKDAARVRAMYTHPDHVRRGIGRLILSLCETAAAEAGFKAVELMATLSGLPLYDACGYEPIERTSSSPAGGVSVPLLRMRKSLLPRADQ